MKTYFYIAIILFGIFFSVKETPLTVAAGPNLISNPGFETSSGTNPNNWTRGRWGTNTTTFSYPTVSGDGSKAVTVNISLHTSGDAKWAFTPVSITAGNTYQYQNSYKSDVPTYITVEYLHADGTVSWVDIANPLNTSVWQTQTFTFIAPPNTISATVYHLINQVGVLEIDNVSLRDITPAPNGNLVYNPSFENITSSNLPAGWTTGKWGTNSVSFSLNTTGYSGSRAGKIDMTSHSSGDAKWNFGLLSTNSGIAYEFSDYYISTVPTYITVQFKKSDGTFSYLDLGTIAPTSAWTLFKKSFSIPPDVTSFTVFHVIKSVGTLVVDDYHLAVTPNDPTKFDKGYVSINFDDGWRSVYDNALPILENAGFIADHFITTGYMNGYFPAYTTPAEVQNLQNRGQIVGAHTRTHPDLTTLSAQAATDEINGSRQDLLSIGISPSSFFAYPLGAYNTNVQDIVRNSGFSAARSSDGGYNDKNTDKYALRRQSMVNTTTFAQAKNYIDTAMTTKTWVILLFHEIDTNGHFYSVTPTFFQQILDYLKQQNITPITVNQGVQMMQP